MDIPTFRSEFPEFSDTAVYPDAQLTLWSTLAEQLLPKCVWNNTWEFAVKLYTAHEITLAAQNAKAGAIGGVPGSSGGIANSKTVGSVSVGYDSAVTSEKDAGWWNLTTYGKQLYRLIQIFGSRCIQL